MRKVYLLSFLQISGLLFLAAISFTQGNLIQYGQSPAVFSQSKYKPDATNLNSVAIHTKFDDAAATGVNVSEGYPDKNGGMALNGGIKTSYLVVGNNIISKKNNLLNTAAGGGLPLNVGLTSFTGSGAVITRSPYLQMGSQNAVTLRWKTDIATNSRVRYGASLGSPVAETDSATITMDHQVRISGLLTDTKYYYEVGEFAGASFTKQEGAADNYFTTLPPTSTTRKIRIVAFGDCGRNEFSYQSNTLNAYKTFIGSPSVAADAWLLLGDNAYNAGLAAEYDANFFGIYGSNILKNHLLFPVPGNHDYNNQESNKTNRALPYYTNFNLPQNAECGGVASNTESYYSYDIGNIHFLALDSYGKEGANTLYDTLGAQAVWVKADLAANTKKWVIAYWHHPPYTFGSHTSDGETDLQAIRDRFIRILERNGVDLIINGHSHAYERSYLLKGFFGNSNTFSKPLHAADSSSGKYDGSANSCPYTFPSGKINHGTVYVVAGSSGAGTATTYSQFNDPNGSHPFSLNTGGCFIFDIQGNRLDAKFLRDNGTIGDRFTIMKDVRTYTDQVVFPGQAVTLTSSWIGGYNWINNGGLTTSSINFIPPVGVNWYRVVDSAGAKTCLQDSFRVIVTSPVAVTLLTYSARLINEKVTLNWTTAQEQDNRYFIIERSINGSDFIPLAKVASQGNSALARNYAFVDEAPLSGTSYYRLSQIATDGSIKNFGIEKIVHIKKSSLRIISNTGAYDGRPASVIIRTNESGELSMKVMDMNGREIQQERFKSVPGDNRRIVNVPGGTYIIEVMNTKGDKAVNKIIVR